MRAFLIFILLLTLTACGGSSNDTPQNCSHSPAFNPSDRTVPDALWMRDFQRSIQGFLPDALQEKLNATAQELLAYSPGISVAIGIPDEGSWFMHSGIANADTAEIVASDHLFQIASITKTFVAAIVLQLADEGQLQLNEPVANWFPDVTQANEMTIEHLLRHTNGLVSFNALREFGTDYYSPDELIALVSPYPLQFCPGSAWAYTNTGYVLLGKIIEAIENAPLREVIRNRITQPLLLQHTILRNLNDEVLIASGHQNRQVVQVEDDYATAYAAGGMASTALELVQFWQHYLAGDVISREYLRQSFHALAPMDTRGEMYYGMGVQLYDVPQGPGLMLGHSGGITGFTSVVAYVADDDLFIAVLVNDKAVSAEAALWAFVQAVREYRE